MTDDEREWKVDPDKAIELYEGTERTQEDVAEELDCSQYYVSKIVNTYEKGKENVSPGDFEETELRSALDLEESAEGDGDEEPDLDPEEPEEPETHTCANCGASIKEGQSHCPGCGIELDWSVLN